MLFTTLRHEAYSKSASWLRKSVTIAELCLLISMELSKWVLQIMWLMAIALTFSIDNKHRRISNNANKLPSNAMELSHASTSSATIDNQLSKAESSSTEGPSVQFDDDHPEKNTFAEQPSHGSSKDFANCNGSLTTASQSHSTISSKCTIYTNGSCIESGSKSARAGYGVYYGREDPRNQFAKLPGDVQSNNRAQLYAVVSALKNIADEIARDQTLRAYEIITNSQSVMEVIQHGTYWKTQGWKSDGNILEDVDLVGSILNLIEKVDHRCSLEFKKVQSDTGDRGGDQVD